MRYDTKERTRLKQINKQRMTQRRRKAAPITDTQIARLIRDVVKAIRLDTN